MEGEILPNDLSPRSASTRLLSMLTADAPFLLCLPPTGLFPQFRFLSLLPYLIPCMGAIAFTDQASWRPITWQIVVAISPVLQVFYSNSFIPFITFFCPSPWWQHEAQPLPALQHHGYPPRYLRDARRSGQAVPLMSTGAHLAISPRR